MPSTPSSSWMRTRMARPFERKWATSLVEHLSQPFGSEKNSLEAATMVQWGVSSSSTKKASSRGCSKKSAPSNYKYIEQSLAKRVFCCRLCGQFEICKFTSEHTGHYSIGDILLFIVYSSHRCHPVATYDGRGTAFTP